MAMKPKKTTALLLSGYDAGSHSYWRKGLERHLPDIEWTVITLPARYFSWRIRGNPISFLSQFSAELSAEYDVIVATSMVDLATLKGIVPTLANTPALMYFHENQFEYPKTQNQSASIEPQMVNLYAAMAADSLVFNSEFNRDSFFSGVDELMAKLPDYVINNLSASLANKASVLPVPIDREWFDLPRRDERSSTQPIKILWNHRWEYDKGPDRLLAFIDALKRKTDLFELHIVGEAFRQVPHAFEQIQQTHAEHIKTFGYIDDGPSYKALLAQCDVVLSTAIHECLGVSVMEAVSAGCLPLVPDRLSYPSLIPSKYRYLSCLDSIEQEAIEAVDHLLTMDFSTDALLRASFEQYSWPELSNLYRDKLLSLIANS